MILLIGIGLFVVTSLLVRVILDNVLYSLCYELPLIYSGIILLFYVLMVFLGWRLINLWRIHKKKRAVKTGGGSYEVDKEVRTSNFHQITQYDSRRSTAVSTSLPDKESELRRETISKQQENVNSGEQQIEATRILFCRKCGTKLPDGSLKCEKCGTEVMSELN